FHDSSPRNSPSTHPHPTVALEGEALRQIRRRLRAGQSQTARPPYRPVVGALLLRKAGRWLPHSTVQGTTKGATVMHKRKRSTDREQKKAQRPRGSGMIFQPLNRDGERSSILHIKFYSHGKPIRESTGSTSVRYAEAMLRDRLSAVTAKKFIEPHD